MSTFIRNNEYMEGDKQYGDIDVPKRPSANHGYLNGEWVLPATPLSILKQAQIDIEEAAYQAAIQAHIAYLNTTFQADSESVKLITDVLVAAGLVMPIGFMWRDSNNVAVNVEGNKLQGLATAILMRGQPLFWAKSARKDAINACLTQAALELYLNPPPPVVEPVVPVEPPVTPSTPLP